MTRHNCDCGFYARTLAGMRKHAQRCERASARLRRTEDRERLVQLERAKTINDAAWDDES